MKGTGGKFSKPSEPNGSGGDGGCYFNGVSKSVLYKFNQAALGAAKNQRDVKCGQNG